MGSLLTDIEVAVGETKKDAQYFLSQGLTHSHIRNARVSWICLTEALLTLTCWAEWLQANLQAVLGKSLVVGFCRDQLLRRLNGRTLLMLCRWRMVRSPYNYLAVFTTLLLIRSSTLASFGVPKSEGHVDRKMVRVLTDDFEIEQRTLLYRDEINRAEIEHIVKQRHLRLAVSTGGNVGQTLLTSGSGRNRNNRKPRNNIIGGTTVTTVTAATTPITAATT